jgi:hypothetical protein
MVIKGSNLQPLSGGIYFFLPRCTRAATLSRSAFSRMKPVASS